MSSRHLVDPELLPLLDNFPQSDWTLEDLPLIREQFRAQFNAMPPPAPDDVTVSEQCVPGRDGAPPVRVVVYTPAGQAAARSAFLHIHGGGYVVGFPEMNAARNRRYAADFNCVVVSVDYRLPPEHPHPAPVEDCYAALRWLHDDAVALGVDRRRIAIGGESAGGGLAAALGLLARDRAEVPVAFQWLIYPMLDDRSCVSTSLNPHAGEFVWTAAGNTFGWRSLLGGRSPGSEGIACYAAPGRAENLAGLPPTLIAVGALDIFLDENLSYADRLLRAGVATELHVYPGAFHGFDMLPEARVSTQFLRDIREALRAGLGVRGQSSRGSVGDSR
jgi:acetyl esterase/lipase